MFLHANEGLCIQLHVILWSSTDFKPNVKLITCISGLMLICKKGTFHEDGNTRVDVDRQMFLMQNVFDENKSWYLDENLKMNGINPSKINKEDEDFMESNLMHAVNGRFYGNLEGLDVCYGRKVAWYLGALGNEVDMHTGKKTMRRKGESVPRHDKHYSLKIDQYVKG